MYKLCFTHCVRENVVPVKKKKTLQGKNYYKELSKKIIYILNNHLRKHR